MKYGEIQYHEIQNLAQPNMVIGRSNGGDWVDRFDEPQITVAIDEVVLEGHDAIDEYAESALERFEDEGDIQAGLVAIQILHHYREHFGDTTKAMHDELISSLMAEKRPNSYLFLLAEDTHPEIAASLHGIMRSRARSFQAFGDAASDHQLMAYIEAVADEGDIDTSIQTLLELRSE